MEAFFFFVPGRMESVYVSSQTSSREKLIKIRMDGRSQKYDTIKLFSGLNLQETKQFAICQDAFHRSET
jgi:hypothetical protein